MTSLDSSLRKSLMQVLLTRPNAWGFLVAPLMNEAAFALDTAAELHIGVLGSDGNAKEMRTAAAHIKGRAHHVFERAVGWFTESDIHELSIRLQEQTYQNPRARKDTCAKDVMASRYMVAAALALLAEAQDITVTKVQHAETYGGPDPKQVYASIAADMHKLEAQVPSIFSELPVLTEKQKDALWSQAFIRMQHQLATAVYYMQFYHDDTICTDDQQNRDRSYLHVLWSDVSQALQRMYMRTADSFCADVDNSNTRAALVAMLDELNCAVRSPDYSHVSKRAFNSAEVFVLASAQCIHAAFTYGDDEAPLRIQQKGAAAALQMLFEALTESHNK